MEFEIVLTGAIAIACGRVAKCTRKMSTIKCFMFLISDRYDGQSVIAKVFGTQSTDKWN